MNILQLAVAVTEILGETAYIEIGANPGGVMVRLVTRQSDEIVNNQFAFSSAEIESLENVDQVLEVVLRNMTNNMREFIQEQVSARQKSAGESAADS